MTIFLSVAIRNIRFASLKMRNNALENETGPRIAI